MKRAKFVTLPNRPPGKSIMELKPETWQVELIGRVLVPRGFDCQWPHLQKDGTIRMKGISDDAVLAVFQDCISKKIFYWTGTRSDSLDHQKIKPHWDASGQPSCRYCFWPAEFFQVSRKTLKTFMHYVYGFGMEYEGCLEEDELEKVHRQKAKLVSRLKEIAYG
jgi:hypothetical protein